jgi:hypothetical protein
LDATPTHGTEFLDDAFVDYVMPAPAFRVQPSAFAFISHTRAVYGIFNSDMASHLAFSDETQYNAGRFRAIGVFTVEASRADQLRQEIRQILMESQITELKWERVRSARDRLAALKICKWVFRSTNSIAIDVLMWDTGDSRHATIGRDDIENLHRMHHHIMKHVLTQRGTGGATWRVHPDEQTSMRWNEVGDFLYRVSMTPKIQRELSSATPVFRIGFKRKYTIESISPQRSHEEPFVQIADLFAGMMVFSWKCFAPYQTWLKAKCGQSEMFQAAELESASKGQQEKFAVLDDFHCKMKNQNAPISLMSSGGLHTRNWKYPLNFWPYQPQTRVDKAPVRSNRAKGSTQNRLSG